MKRTIIPFIFLLITNSIFSQQTIFEKEYSQLPFQLQIENSGIYSIASFDVGNGVVSFSSFTKNGIFNFTNGKFVEVREKLKRGNDFLVTDLYQNGLCKKDKKVEHRDESIRFKKDFFHGNLPLSGSGGVLSNYNGDELIVSVPNRNNLFIKSNLEGIKDEIEIDFPSNLACADLIGIDNSGNLFLWIEKYLSDIPLKVERNVVVLSKEGKILSRLELPNIKYLFTLKDLQIDKSGNLYHLISFTNRVEIVRWDNLTKPTKGIIKYPNKYNEEIHFNDFVTTNEIPTKLPVSFNKVQSGVSRTEALRIADTYVLHKYDCSSANLAPTDTKAPDGDIVRTPDWLIVGKNARIPYKWGGFNTISQFDDGLANGKYAGDINTDGVSSYAVGVDCSGYVSRCWQMSYHASTAYMPNITTQYSSWDDLKPGDAIHKVGHVRLFVERNINGTLKVVESTGRGWGVSYYTYATSDLSAYTPRYYNSMENNFNAQRPILKSASFVSSNRVQLKWTCDSLGILGYRIYSSIDGDNWSVVLIEDNCKSSPVDVSVSSKVNFYRISSVKNDSPNFSESNWSNVLGIGNFSSNKKVLIVDGFNREVGSWRGPGHTFVEKYCEAIEGLSYDFTSIKNSELENGSFNLNDFDFVFWMLGDESTVDETFSSTEQGLVESYLENGGSLFVSGSEIGWDLDHKGTEKDKAFYSDYLKANYISDDAGQPNTASGIENTSMDGCTIHFGQTYEEDYPDEIEGVGGSSYCMKYGNNKGAGIQFSGNFGSSEKKGNLIYLAFPLETTANDSDFNQIISGAINYFIANPTSVKKNFGVVNEFHLQQNYPNPFNPTTLINYSIPTSGDLVQIKIYDVLGNEITTLVNKEQPKGNYKIKFNGSELSSGIYFYLLRAGKNYSVKKMMLLK